MKHTKPIHLFLILMEIGTFLAIGSYDLGKRAGTEKIITNTPTGMTNYRYNIDEDKIRIYTESYKSVGCIILLIGGIGLVATTLNT